MKTELNPILPIEGSKFEARWFEVCRDNWLDEEVVAA